MYILPLPPDLLSSIPAKELNQLVEVRMMLNSGLGRDQRFPNSRGPGASESPWETVTLLHANTLAQKC